MDEKHSALLWQLMQSLGGQPEGSPAFTPQHQDGMLHMLKPLLSPKQQCMIDLLIKMNEIKALVAEMQVM